MNEKKSEQARDLSSLMAELSELSKNDPKLITDLQKRLTSVRHADEFAEAFEGDGKTPKLEICASSENPLSRYFQNHHEGRGIWKWQHYFEIYHRHLCKFIDKPVDVLEIGVYSGGSLDMWHHYFGEHCHVHGVDIEESCRSYQSGKTTIHVGDQADRDFWKSFHQKVPRLDVLIDDGGHTPEQQRITLEEVLPKLNPGGVYICEDITGFPNSFSQFACGLVEHLNRATWKVGETLESCNTNFQATIHSIHFYPFVVVIEKRDTALPLLAAPKMGTEWEPFFD